jgi:hypothetical protein
MEEGVTRKEKEDDNRMIKMFDSLTWVLFTQIHGCKNSPS